MTSPNWTPEEAQAAIETITNRAARDADFRTLCLTDPAEAVRAATGRELPEGFVLRFVDNAHASLTVVLPDSPTGDLADAELDGISAGFRLPRLEIHCTTRKTSVTDEAKETPTLLP